MSALLSAVTKVCDDITIVDVDKENLGLYLWRVSQTFLRDCYMQSKEKALILIQWGPDTEHVGQNCDHNKSKSRQKHLNFE